MGKKRPLVIAILGPTASGKTSLAISMAEHFKTEIISADSRQVFSELLIGTARPTEEEMKGIPHHLVGHKALEEDYSAGQWARDAETIIASSDPSRPMIICGGSGLYVDALLRGLDDVPRFLDIRTQLNSRFEEEGLDPLVAQLEDLDPVTAQRIDRQNPQRVIRALEVSLGAGRPYSSFLRGIKSEPKFEAISFALRWSREMLRERVEQRTHRMMEEGLLEEATSVKSFRGTNALNTVGYKEVFRHLDGEMGYEECVEEIIKNTMRYAKRQMTWLRRMEELNWIDLPANHLVPDLIHRVDSAVQR